MSNFNLRDFTVLRDYVMVKRVDAGDKTSGGIFLPENNKDGRQRLGEVLQVGPGELELNPVTGQMFHKPMDLKVGDIVTYHEFAGQTMNKQITNQEEINVMRERECVAFLRKNED